MKDIVFPKKTIMTTAKKTPEQSVFHFNFPLTDAALWSSRPDLTSEKCPENNWKSTWTKQPEITSCMCHSFSPFNHELSCNSLKFKLLLLLLLTVNSYWCHGLFNSPWHQTKLKVSVFYIHAKYIHTYIHTYSEMPQIRSYIFLSLAK